MKPTAAFILSALALSAWIQAPAPVSPALTSVVEAERSFARMSVDKGRRQAFLAFFSDDALFFSPGPVTARERIVKWPANDSFTLDWEPRYGDASAAGDLGYTTGPFFRISRTEAGKVLATGWYFTLWKKQPDGSWKVAVDAGVQGPPGGPLRPGEFHAAPATAVAANQPAPPLPDADRRLCESIASSGMTAALLSSGTEATRVYRDGIGVIAGVVAVKSYFAQHQATLSCEPVKNVVAGSADLGYTYGKYSRQGATPASGYYLRVWRREGNAWKLAVDLEVPSE